MSSSEWVPHVDPASGFTYYFNASTGESRWTAPGWHKYVDASSGRPYWAHTDTCVRQWTDPVWQVFFDTTYNVPYWYNSDTQERTWDRPEYAPEWEWEDGEESGSGESGNEVENRKDTQGQTGGGAEGVVGIESVVGGAADGGSPRAGGARSRASSRYSGTTIPPPPAGVAPRSGRASFADPADARGHSTSAHGVDLADKSKTSPPAQQAPATASAAVPTSVPAAAPSPRAAEGRASLTREPRTSLQQGQASRSLGQIPGANPALRRMSSRLSMFVGLDPRASLGPGMTALSARRMAVSLPASTDASSAETAVTSTGPMRAVTFSLPTAQHARQLRRLSNVTETSANELVDDFLDYENDLSGRASPADAASTASDAGTDTGDARTDRSSSLVDEFALPEDDSIFRQLVPAAAMHVVPAGLTVFQDASVDEARAAERARGTQTWVEPVALLDATVRAAGEYRRRLLTHAVLSKLTFFKGITVQEARTLANAFTLWACRSGTPIVTEGDVADCLFFVARGSLRLFSARTPETRSRTSSSLGGDDGLPRHAASAGGAARTQALLPLPSGLSERAQVDCMETRVPEGCWFGIESLMCDAFRHEWSAVATGGADMLGQRPSGPADAKPAASAVALSEASTAAINTLVQACGAAHLLVLTRENLTATMGSDWIRQRKLMVLTGVRGVPFAASAPGPWAPANAAAAFAPACVSTSGAAMVRLATARATNTSAASAVGFAASDPSVSLLAANSDALAMLALHLRDVPFFGKLDAEGLEEVARCSVLLRRKRDTVLIVEGTPAVALYVVIHGHLKIMTQGVYASSMGAGAYVGEVSMLKGVPARATVVTAADCLLLALSKPSFEKLTRRAVDVRAAFSDRISSLLELAKPWKQLRFLSALTDYQIGWLALSSRTISLKSGLTIRVCRRHNEGCLLLASGKVSVTLDGLSLPISPGRPIGLHNLLATSTSDPVLGDSDDDAAIHVTAQADSVLVRITRQDVMSVLGSVNSTDAALGNFDAAAAVIASAGAGLDATSSYDDTSLLLNHAFASVLTRSRLMRHALVNSISMKENSAALRAMIECASACDDLTQRMLGVSPTAAPLLSLHTWLRRRLEAIVMRVLIRSDDDNEAILKSIPESVRRPLLSILLSKPLEQVSGPLPPREVVQAGLAVMKGWPATLLADLASAFDFALKAHVDEFRTTIAMKQAVRAITSEAQQASTGRVDVKEKALQSFMNSAVTFQVSKLNRYGRWQRRTLRVFVRSGAIEFDDTASGTQRFSASALSAMERQTKDASAKQVKLAFTRTESERDFVLRFEAPEARDTFITLIQMLAPHVPVTDDCMAYVGGGRVSYDVLLITRGLAVRRTLTIDSQRRMLSRAHREELTRPTAAGALAQEAALLADDAPPGAALPPKSPAGAPHTAASAAPSTGMPAHDFAITLSTRLEPSVSDPCRLKLCFGADSADAGETFEVIFPSAAAREHFAGSLRSLIYNVNVPAARLLGLHRSGIVPDTVSIFVGTFNCGESKPPKEVTSLAAWIPAHRYDIIVVGLQECNARDEWIKAIEASLLPTNAPSMTAAPVYLAAGFTPAQAPATDTSTAKDREDPDLGPAPSAKDGHKPGSSLGIFGRLAGKDKDKHRHEKDDRDKPSSTGGFTGFDKMSASADSQAAGPSAGEQWQESCDLFGYSRDAGTGLLAPPKIAGSTSAAAPGTTGDAGAHAPAKPATGGKAGKLLGLGGPAARVAGKAGGIETSKPAAHSGTVRPDPPVTPSPYVTVCSVTLWGIHLVVFARATVAQHISQVQSATTATGIGGVLGNKGGVGISMVYREATSLAFITAHLAARPERLNQRAENYSEICRSMRLTAEHDGGQLLHQFDHVFWLGDLNYRIDMGSMGTPEEFNKVQTLIAARDFPTLLAADQLTRELEAGRIFAGFREGPIRFAPTYRMEKGREEYSNKRYQNASYTDRILWRSRHGLRSCVSQLYYDACFPLNMSDHRPVSAGFIVGTKLPFMNLDYLDSINQAAQRTSCTIALAHARYDDVVLTRDAQAAAEVGLDVSAVVEGIQKARTKVLTAALMSEDAESGSVLLSSSGTGVGLTSSDAAARANAVSPGTVDAASAAALYASDGSMLMPSLRPDDFYLEINASFSEASVESYFGTPVPGIGTTLASSIGGSVAGGPSGSVAVGAGGVMLGSCSAEWRADAIPDLNPLLPDPRWLQQQALHVTVRRRGGALVGQAEVSLRDAYACMQKELPLSADALTLSSVFAHPMLARAFAAFLASQRSDESLHFYRAYIAYQELTAVGGIVASAEVRFAAASVIAETFLWPSARNMVNVPGTVIGTLKQAFARAEAALAAAHAPAGGAAAAAHGRHAAAVSALFGASSKIIESTSSATAIASWTADDIIAADVFSDAADEVYRQMEREALPPFRKMYSSVAQAGGVPVTPAAAPSPTNASTRDLLGKVAGQTAGDDANALGNIPTTPCAPFAVPLLRDGCTVGLLRGAVFISCMDAVAEKSRRLEELQRMLKRRSSARRTTDAGMNSASAGFALQENAAPTDPGRLAAMSARVGSAAISGLAMLSTALVGSATAPSASGTPAPSAIAELARLPAAEKARVATIVESLISGVDMGPAIGDDYVLLADLLTGAALSERDAILGMTRDAAPTSRARAQTAVLLRAAAGALSASEGDRSATTRALRVLLHLALHRLARVDSADSSTSSSPARPASPL